jgi:hypothetical protein
VDKAGGSDLRLSVPRSIDGGETVRSKRLAPLFIAAALLIALPAAAQPDNDIVDDGVSINGGATYWPEDWPLGLMLDAGYGNFDIRSGAAQQAGASGGDVDLWSVNVNGLLQSGSEGPVGFQVFGGVGAYHISAKLTDPGLYVGPICDPWSWWCYPGIIPGDVVVGELTETEFGWNAGLGITFELKSGSQLFLDTRYHWIKTREATEIVPIVFGYRW